MHVHSFAYSLAVSAGNSPCPAFTREGRIRPHVLPRSLVSANGSSLKSTLLSNRIENFKIELRIEPLIRNLREAYVFEIKREMIFVVALNEWKF